PWRASREVVPVLVTLRQAAWEDCWVAATFLRARSIRIGREIAPYGLVAKGQSWYVVWVGRSGDVRVDNAAAVIGASLLDETFDRPPEFDLTRFWTRWAASHEASRSSFGVRLRAHHGVLSMLETDSRRPIEPIDAVDGVPSPPWVEVVVEFDDFEQARASLLAYGGAVDVIEPQALRLSILDYAARILEAGRGAIGPEAE
ncbi:WYL domain-containing protein, partial [Candidatus Bipolaricaulota bacterium]|nr:WYL domain-containing protein [Candidatus Bipolaricaulota bacterium]